MVIKVEISVGELLDKISILKIKSSKIRDPEKLKYIKLEVKNLISVAVEFGVMDDAIIIQLVEINSRLWDIEDDIRKLEKEKNFSHDFIRLARLVYTTNDERFSIKNKADKKYNSTIREQKSYEEHGA